MSKPDAKFLKLFTTTKKCITNKCSMHSKKLKNYIEKNKKKYNKECKNSKKIMEQSCLNKFLNDKEYIQLKEDVKKCGMLKCKKEASELEKHLTTKIEGFLEERKEDNKIKIKAIKLVLKNKASKIIKTKEQLSKSASNSKLKTTIQYYYDNDIKSLNSELKQLNKRVKKKSKKKTKK
jgi:hypothetical protein